MIYLFFFVLTFILCRLCQLLRQLLNKDLTSIFLRRFLTRRNDFVNPELFPQNEFLLNRNSLGYTFDNP